MCAVCCVCVCVCVSEQTELVIWDEHGEYKSTEQEKQVGCRREKARFVIGIFKHSKVFFDL